MAKIVQEVEVLADIDQAKKALAKLERQFKETNDAAEKGAKRATKAQDSMAKSLIKQALAFGAVAKAAQIVFSELRNGAAAALKYEQTTLKLSVALRASGDATLRSLPSLQAQSALLEDIAGISDEVTRGMQTMALSAGVAVDDIDPLIRASISLSNAMGISVDSAFRNLLKSTSGLQGELGEMLPQVKALTVEQLKAGGAIDLVTREMGDQLTVMTQGTAGAQLGLTNAWSSFTEELVKSSQSFGPIEKGMRGLTHQLREITKTLQSEGFVSGVERFITTFAAGSGLGVAVRQAGGATRMLQDMIDSGDVSGITAGDLGNVLRFNMEDAIGAPVSGVPSGIAKPSKEDQDRINKAAKAAVAARRAAADKAHEERKSQFSRKFAGFPLLDDGVEEEAQARADFMLELERRAADAAFEIREANAERIADLERRSEEASATIFNSQQKRADLAMRASSAVASHIGNTLQMMLDGQEVSLNQFLGGMLSAIGQVLFQQGVADLARAGAMLFNPLTAGLAGPLASAAAAEMATGAAIMAVGGKSSGGGTAKRGGGGRSSGGGASAFAGGATGGGATGGGGGDKTIIINVQGAISTAQAGREIRDALAEAQRQGF